MDIQEIKEKLNEIEIALAHNDQVKNFFLKEKEALQQLLKEKNGDVKPKRTRKGALSNQTEADILAKFNRNMNRSLVTRSAA